MSEVALRAASERCNLSQSGNPFVEKELSASILQDSIDAEIFVMLPSFSRPVTCARHGGGCWVELFLELEKMLPGRSAGMLEMLTKLLIFFGFTFAVAMILLVLFALGVITVVTAAIVFTIVTLVQIIAGIFT